MNLNLYDNVKERIDKTKSWINAEYKLLFSREIKFRPYFSIMKRYDTERETYDFFIAMMDFPVVNKTCKKSKKDKYGRTKIPLTSIWNERNFVDSNINVHLVDTSEEGEVYLLDA